MSRRLFWQLCTIIGTGVVAMFYVINLAISQIENDMSLLALEDRAELVAWSRDAETLHAAGDLPALNHWLEELQETEETWAAVASADVQHIAGNRTRFDDYHGYNMGRNVAWQIHLYFEENPIMELPFSDGRTSLLIELPMRMRPGSLWDETQLLLQVILPLAILILVSIVLYRHIMEPLRELQHATRTFSEGNFDVRVGGLLGNRDDELTQLANTFDQMAQRIGELFHSQRQLLTDLSHELRTPLSRLDIAVERLIADGQSSNDPTVLQDNLDRIHRESRHIRKLVDDTLTLSWLENEAPSLQEESLDLVDLLEVLIEDARFEYPDRDIEVTLPHAARIANSNHRVLAQALENILRNALRYTPAGKTVSIDLSRAEGDFEISIADEGPGVPDKHLSAIFRPFFRVDASRPAGASFGLGLALARRQLAAVAARVKAANLDQGGLLMTVTVPQG
ncbi:MAG: histidine kinase sensor domain-containing protein [Pseudomonadota bacterium]